MVHVGHVKLPHLYKLRHSPEEVRIDGLRGLGHVNVVQEAVDDCHDRCLDAGGALLQHLHQETEHVEREVRVEIVQVLHHAPKRKEVTSSVEKMVI